MIAIGLIVAGVVIEVVVFVSLYLTWYKVNKKGGYNITFFDVARVGPGHGYHVAAQLVGVVLFFAGLVWSVIDLIKIIF